jgi:hypothetical protein
MDSNAQIIRDLQNKIGFSETLDFLSDYKGVPVVIKGQIHEIRPESIIFKVEAPDSICMSWDQHALLLQDSFISGIQGKIIEFDLEAGIVELGELVYSDRGFGGRAMVRVEPQEVIEASLVADKISFPCQVIDLSLNGFGLLTEKVEAAKLSRGKNVSVKLNLVGKAIEIPCRVLGVFPKEETVRLAVSFSAEAPGSAVVTRYITRRRAEIRQEIQAAYQAALGKKT